MSFELNQSILSSKTQTKMYSHVCFPFQIEVYVRLVVCRSYKRWSNLRSCFHIAPLLKKWTIILSLNFSTKSKKISDFRNCNLVHLFDGTKFKRPEIFHPLTNIRKLWLFMKERYRVFQLDLPPKKRLLGHQKCTFKY